MCNNHNDLILRINYLLSDDYIFIISSSGIRLETLSTFSHRNFSSINMIKRREIGDANASHRCAQQVGQKVYVD